MIEEGSTAEGILLVGILISVLVVGVVSLIILYVYRAKCNSRCKCFAEIRNRREYEEIIEYERSFCQDICGICLEQMKTGENLYLVFCGHKFHTECMDRWLKEDNRCPLCNYRGHIAA